MNMSNMQFMQNQAFGAYPFGDGIDLPTDLCIDEPAKRLFSLNGGFNQPQQQHSPTSSATQLGDGQYSENSELAKTIREEQKRAGVPDPSADGGPPKPFHCPVIGCEKAYKNQNGLKYHKSVSSSSRICVYITKSKIARPQHAEARGQRQWNFFNCEPRDTRPLRRHGRYGKVQTISMSFLRQTIQES